MSTKVTIKMVPGYPRILQETLSVRAVERMEAERAAEIARATAPRQTGRYRDSIAVEEEAGKVALVARDFKAHWIEWGTVRTRAYATLRNAAAQVASHIRED